MVSPVLFTLIRSVRFLNYLFQKCDGALPFCNRCVRTNRSASCTYDLPLHKKHKVSALQKGEACIPCRSVYILFFLTVERPARPVCSPVISFFLIPVSSFRVQHKEESQCVPSLPSPSTSTFSCVFPTPHTTTSADSDVTRHDLSVNDAPLPAIKTNACTMPLRPSPSNSPRLKPGGSWQGGHRSQVILPAQIPLLYLAPADAHPLPTNGFPIRS